MCKLVEPTEKYLVSNTEYIWELFDRGEMTKEEYEEKISIRKNIQTYKRSLKDLDVDDLGLHIFWLICSDRFIGTFRLNERLNEKQRKGGGNTGYTIRPSEYGRGYGTKILELGLQKAKQLGMKKILIDCREDNVASKKIIEKNGGVFVESLADAGGGSSSLKYVIHV